MKLLCYIGIHRYITRLEPSTVKGVSCYKFKMCPRCGKITVKLLRG